MVTAHSQFPKYFADTLHGSMRSFAQEPSIQGQELFLPYLDRVFKLKTRIHPDPPKLGPKLRSALDTTAAANNFQARAENEAATRSYLARYGSFHADLPALRPHFNKSYLAFLRANPKELIWNRFESVVTSKVNDLSAPIPQLINSFTEVAAATQEQGLSSLYNDSVDVFDIDSPRKYLKYNRDFAAVAKHCETQQQVELFDDLLRKYSAVKTSSPTRLVMFLEGTLTPLLEAKPVAKKVDLLKQIAAGAMSIDVNALEDSKIQGLMKALNACTYRKKTYELVNKLLEPIRESSEELETYTTRLANLLSAVQSFSVKKTRGADVNFLNTIVDSWDLTENIDTVLDIVKGYAVEPGLRQVLESTELAPLLAEAQKTPMDLRSMLQAVTPYAMHDSVRGKVDDYLETYETLVTPMDPVERLDDMIDILSAVFQTHEATLPFFSNNTTQKRIIGPLKADSNDYVQDAKDLLAVYGPIQYLDLDEGHFASFIDESFDINKPAESGLTMRLNAILETVPSRDLDLNPEYYQWRLDRLDSTEKKVEFLNDLTEVLNQSPAPKSARDVEFHLTRLKFDDYFEARDWPYHIIIGIVDFNVHDIFDILQEVKVPEFMLLNFQDALDKELYDEVYKACAAIGNMATLHILAEDPIAAKMLDYTDDEDGFYVGHHPYEEGSPEARDGFNQSLQVLRNNILRGRSSIHDANAFRRVGDEGMVQYRDFAQNFLNVPFEEVPNPDYKGWKDHSFPGNGYSFGNFKLSAANKNFVAVTTWDLPPVVGREELDEDTEVELGMKRSTALVESLQRSQIYRMRGATIIKPKASDKQFYLMSSEKKPESFSYVFFNEHYANPTNSTAFLVPTKILDGLETAQDFARVIAPEKLYKDYRVLNLGSAVSIYGSGLPAARALGSPPYHEHETNLYRYYDISHRPHYSVNENRSAGWDSEWDDEIEARTEPFRQDQQDIADIAFKFDTMMKQLDQLESLHIMGYDNFEAPQDSFADAVPQEDFVPGNLGYAFSLVNAWSQEYKNRPAKDPGDEAVLVDVGTNAKGGSAKNWRFKIDPTNGKFYEKPSPNAQPKVLDFAGNRDAIEMKILKYLYDVQQNPDVEFKTLRFLPRNITD